MALPAGRLARAFSSQTTTVRKQIGSTLVIESLKSLAKAVWAWQWEQAECTLEPAIVVSRAASSEARNSARRGMSGKGPGWRAKTGGGMSDSARSPDTEFDVFLRGSSKPHLAWSAVQAYLDRVHPRIVTTDDSGVTRHSKIDCCRLNVGCHK